VARLEFVRELEIYSDQRDVVADAEFNVRPEGEIVDQRFRFVVTTEIKLVGFCRNAGSHAITALGGGRNRREGEEREAKRHESKAEFHNKE